MALTILMGASVGMAADVTPLYFTHDDGTSVGDLSKNQEFWNDLMRYKMFGAKGIAFVGGEISVPDSSGWFGTADGDFTTANTKHHVGGPILIGGNVKFDDGSDTISTGPVRVTGSIETSNFGGDNIVRGAQCVTGSVADKYAALVPESNKFFNFNYSACPDSVPEINRELRAPTIDWNWFTENGYATHPAIVMDGANNSVTHIDVFNIDVPPIPSNAKDSQDSMFNYVVESISFTNGAELRIRMPAGGRLTRIFLKNGFPTINSNSKIRVVYMSTDAEYNTSTGKWTSGTETFVENKKYKGNLLFYTVENIKFDALIQTDSIQGTFISKGEIYIKQHMTLAGQLLAQNLKIDAQFDGRGFIYVPFDPSVVDPTALTGGTFIENNQRQQVNIELDGVAETDVFLKYCFDIDSHLEDGEGFAGYDDFNLEDAPMPICGKSVGEVKIPKGSKTASVATRVFVNVVKDNKIEGDELFVIKIFDVVGAVLPQEKDEMDFPLTIEDSNIKPPSTKDTTITIDEDQLYVFEAFPFKASADNPTATLATVELNTLPAKGSLKYDGQDVTAGKSIPASSIGKLTYQAKANEFGDNYASFKFQVVDTKGFKSDEIGTYIINVKSVNDTAIIDDGQEFVVNENSEKGTKVGPKALQVTDIEGDALTYTVGNVVSNTGKKVDGLFTFDDKGNILVNKDNVLDYESKDTIYTVNVVVYDGHDYSHGVVKVSVKDVNEAPVAADTTFTVSEHAKSGDEVGKVRASDEDSLHIAEFGTLKYSLLDSTVGSSVIFDIDRTTGMITVSEVGADLLNYEDENVYYVKVRVTDGKLSDTAIVKISLDDENEPPYFDSTTYHGSVAENSAIDVHVITVTAKDNDTAPGNAALKYSLDVVDMFKVDETTGEITVNKEGLDYEKDSVYVVTLTATDGAGATATTQIEIKVIDVNENPIIISDGIANIKEHQPIGTPVDTLIADDYDKFNPDFRKNKFVAIDGDTTLFAITKKGVITTKVELNYEEYEKDGKTEFALIVKLVDEKDPTLFDLDTISISLLNVNEPPEFIFYDKDSVPENSVGGYVIDTLFAHDPDGDAKIIRYELVGESNEFVVSENGVITVKDGAHIDYEEQDSYVITVKAIDEEGLFRDTTITIYVINLNEPIHMDDQEFTVREDAVVGKIGVVVSKDEDEPYPEFSQKTYTLVGKSDLFEVEKDGTIKLIGELDYETQTEHKIKVRVTDGEFSDTATVTIHVTDVYEYEVAKITVANNPDSTWLYPDTIYVNYPNIDVEWCILDKSEKKCLIDFLINEPLEEGKNLIIVPVDYKNPSVDEVIPDTLVVYYSTKAPIVTMVTDVEANLADNIYTVAEQQDSTDKSFYVNEKKNDIKVTVKDPVSKTDSSFSIDVNLETIAVPAVTFSSLHKVLDAKVSLKDTASSKNVSRIMLDGEDGEKVIKVSRTIVVKGDTVTMSYMTDTKGNVLKDENGDEVITVSKLVKVNGISVTVSSKVDAFNGKVIEGSDGSFYNVSYEYIDKKSKNNVYVSYNVDEKVQVVKNKEGNIAYNISYTYVNKFGNAASKSITVILDQIPPKVEIRTPVDGDVIHANFVEVEWYVDKGDGKGFVKQDTLVTQGLEKGSNVIVRFYKDKAGNVAADTVFVMMKSAKNVEIAIEQPVTEITEDKVEEYYSVNEPKKGEEYAVSIYNPNTGKEQEVLTSVNGKKRDGKGDEPYPGLKGHLGPTLEIDVKAPVVSAVGGLATLDDLVSSDGLVALDGVDAANSEKISVDKYVEKYCSDGFRRDYAKAKDISKLPLYDTKLYVKIWVYTTLSQFVDYFSFSQDLNDPELVSDAGLLNMYFEQKPDKNGDVRDASGRLYATGSYVYKSEVSMRSTLSCTLPPVRDSSKADLKKGAKRKATEDLLKSFGYKRPKAKHK
ncbi:MAG: cadherin repeat domain-containing protein [Fibrobacteraceae bacterium]|nr:cadherin repeat domain-containing protein [Fibrobacteraceae bacterium]